MNRTKWALLLVFLVAFGFAARFLLKPKPQSNAENVREVATRGLADYLARTQSGRRVLVFSNPFAREANTAPAIVKMEEAGIRGLQEGWKGKLAVAAIALPELKAGARENPQAIVGDPETTTPLSYLVAPDAFDNQAKLHPGCDLVVSLIGLPAELDRCEIWTQQGPPAFALLLPDVGIIGGTDAVRRAVNSGKLVAFVLRRPGAPPDSEPATWDSRSEFQKRFVLVTRDNFEEVAKSNPELQ
jgi:hypothetical protein